MTKHSQGTEPPFLAKLLRAYLRSNLMGGGRFTFSLANKFKSLQAVPIVIANRSPIYMDLRSEMSHEWLKGSPWANTPLEAAEQTVMRRFVKRGDIAFDVGANLGLHTTLLSELVGLQGQVCLFEPNRELLPTLSRTVSRLSNGFLYPYALSDQSGESSLYVPNDHSMGSLADYTSDPSLADWREEIGLSRARLIPCELRTIDKLIETDVVPRPDFIKCDVEGAELMVFKGGSKTLNRDQAPIILFEAIAECAHGFGLAKSAAMDFLGSLSLACYQFFEVREGGKLVNLQGSDFKSPNILAIPQSKSSQLLFTHIA